MLSRSNFSIRQFMPGRRHQSDDSDNVSLFWDKDEKASLRVTDGRGSPSPSATIIQEPRQWSSRGWLQPSAKSSKSSTKKPPQPIIVVRSAEDLRRITSSRLPPVPDTPYSSKSSLCSCEYHAAVASPRWLPRQRSPGLSHVQLPLSSKSADHSPGDESCQRRISPPPGSPLENPRPSPQLPGFAAAATRKESLKGLPTPNKLTFDLLEALEIQPDNDEMTGPRLIPLPSTPGPTSGGTSTPNREDTCLEGPLRSPSYTDKIEQLIREADEAFNTGTDGITPEGKLDLEQALCLRLVRPPGPTLEPAALKLANRSTVSRSRSPPNLHTRRSSVSKVRRQKSQNSRRRIIHGSPKKPLSLRWTASARDLLTIRLFSRIEVDEVLSPSRLQEIRMSRCSSLVPRPSTDTLWTEGSDTPVDPFSLQDLPSRIGAAGVRLSIPTPIEEVATPRSFDFDLAQDSVRREEQASPEAEHYIVSTPTPTPGTVTMEIKDIDIHFPAPPAKNPARFNTSPRRDLPHLPSIPEVMVASADSSSTLSPTSVPRSQEQKNDGYFFLPSTHHTMTAPSFRHGPIRIAKEDVALAYSSPQKLTEVDRSLDWTAFQISILGGAGDFYSESRDYSRPEETEEEDGVCEWWDGFGFEGYGSIERRDSTMTTSSTITASSVSSDRRESVTSAAYSLGGSGNTDSDGTTAISPSSMLPIPVESEHPSGFWNSLYTTSSSVITAGLEGGLLTSRFNTAQAVGLRRWTLEGHPKHPTTTTRQHLRLPDLDLFGMKKNKKKKARRPSLDSVESLPQSPMLDLVISEDVRGEEHVVPMGFNLGHDLGDFLAWEAQNVCVGGFGMREVELMG